MAAMAAGPAEDVLKTEFPSLTALKPFDIKRLSSPASKPPSGPTTIVISGERSISDNDFSAPGSKTSFNPEPTKSLAVYSDPIVGRKDC